MLWRYIQMVEWENSVENMPVILVQDFLRLECFCNGQRLNINLGWQQKPDLSSLV